MNNEARENYLERMRVADEAMEAITDLPHAHAATLKDFTVLEQRYLDKLRAIVPKGPWSSEPDRVEFAYSGLYCLLRRVLFGNWCGYVGVEENKLPLNRRSMDSFFELDVHGGVTYYGKSCGTISLGVHYDLVWIGFDCGHARDLQPFIATNAMAKIKKYRTLEFAEREVKKLADQIFTKVIIKEDQ